MILNHFVHGSAAERYARGRPYFHPQIVAHIGRLTGRVERALDAGCGTGMSSVALAELAGTVIGADAAVEMLACAEVHPSVRYLAAAAEALPFGAGSFQMVTAGLAFHWFDRERFLAEARRVLVPSGWLVIYNNWFGGTMRENPAFAESWRARYLARYPSPPRRGQPLTETDAERSGFTFVEDTRLENEVRMSCAQLIGYLTTQTNIIAAVEQGRETLEDVVAWLTESLRPFFLDETATFPFGSSLWMLRAAR